MINILPTETKSELRYARLNSLLLKHLIVTFTAGLLLIMLISGARWYANHQLKDYQAEISARQSQLSSFKADEQKIAQLQANLGLIDKLLTGRTQYSELLDDLADNLPPQAYLTQLTLTGDDTKPLEIKVNTDSFNRAAEVRNGLLRSKRIQSADIQNVSRNEEGGGYTLVLVLAFAPGGAR